MSDTTDTPEPTPAGWEDVFYQPGHALEDLAPRTAEPVPGPATGTDHEEAVTAMNAVVLGRLGVALGAAEQRALRTHLQLAHGYREDEPGEEPLPGVRALLAEWRSQAMVARHEQHHTKGEVDHSHQQVAGSPEQASAGSDRDPQELPRWLVTERTWVSAPSPDLAIEWVVGQRQSGDQEVEEQSASRFERRDGCGHDAVAVAEGCCLLTPEPPSVVLTTDRVRRLVAEHAPASSLGDDEELLELVELVVGSEAFTRLLVATGEPGRDPGEGSLRG